MRRTSAAELAFLAIVVVAVVIGSFAYFSIVRQRAVLATAYSARLNVLLLERSMLDEETGVRGFVSTGERLFLDPYENALAAYPRSFATLRRQLLAAGLNDVAAEVQRYDVARMRWNVEVLRPLIDREPGTDRAALLREGKADVDAMRVQLAAIDATLNERTNSASGRVQQSIGLSIGAIVLCTIILGGVALVIERQRDAEERALRVELDRRNTELERSNESLQQFAYVASHDLQEPLRTVASFAQLLQRRYRGTLDANADEYIGFIVDGATRMQQLINDVLQYSRVTTQGRALEPVALAAVVERVKASLYAVINERHVVIEDSGLPSVLGDEAQLAQLFQNLIGNAIKYNSNEIPRVRLGATRDGAFWQIDVADNGIGIEAKYFERIFGLFQRLHGRAEYSGTGIGLALCKRIVERHGGRIWVQSGEGQGSTFSFTLRAPEDQP